MKQFNHILAYFTTLRALLTPNKCRTMVGMEYVYIDESGSEGRSGRYIVFASISVLEPRILEKQIKKLWRAKPQFHLLGEFHAKAVDDATRKRVLLLLAGLDLKIHYHLVDKTKQLQNYRSVYYKELAKFIELHMMPRRVMVDRKDTISVINKSINSLNLNNIYDGVEFEESHRAKQLQAVDFVAWSLGRMYEYNDSSYYDIVRHKESPLF